MKTAKKSVHKTQSSKSPLRAGSAVFIRAVTFHYVGRIVSIDADVIVLDDVSWVADSGRFSVALETGALNEVERMPNGAAVVRGAIVDIVPWKHSLPVATR